MANLYLTDTNLAARRVYWQGNNPATGAAELNLGSATVLSAVVRASNNILLPKPCNVVIPITMTSGSLEVKLSINAGTPNFSAPDDDQTFSTTAKHVVSGQTTVAKPYFAIQITETTGMASAVIASADCLITALYAKGGGYHEATTGLSGIPAAGGSYSAAVT